MVSYLSREEKAKHLTSTILWKNWGLGTIYNQLHANENASRVCYLKTMDVQGIMARIHALHCGSKIWMPWGVEIKNTCPYPD